MSQNNQKLNFIDKEILKEAFYESFYKLNIKTQFQNKVMFIVFLSSIFTSILSILSLTGYYQENFFFVISISTILWFTVLFSNFAEAIAEGRAKAQASSLKDLKKSTFANKLKDESNLSLGENAQTLKIDSSLLKLNDLVLVKAGEIIPCDGEIVMGMASVNESAITGESAPVIRGAGCDFNSVTGGTTLVSDFLIIKVNAEKGQSFIDKMINMVENAKRRKTPNEIALTVLLLSLTAVFIMVTITLYPFSEFAVKLNEHGQTISLSVLVALLVCLIPTTIGALLSAIGVAGMGRLLKSNVIAKSGRAIEAAGDVDVLLLDKTGTITYGNRQASEFYPDIGVSKEDLARSALLSSIADDTPEGKSIVHLANKMGVKEKLSDDFTFIPFSAITKMSGININGRQIRKGSADTMTKYLEDLGLYASKFILHTINNVASKGSTPLLVVDNNRLMGVIELKDIVKGGIKKQFEKLRTMGIRTVMITGDNPLTAAAIAAEAGVDDFLAEATPESKLNTIIKFQKEGLLVAMTGDGTNDAPALAQADVAVAMNSGTQSAKESANMIDLDSSPTKLLDIVHIGKQMLITRGSLTTFSLANDVAKYFAIIPAAFSTIYPELNILNVMNLSSPSSALLSAIIFNALIIIFLIPLALRGVAYKPMPAKKLLIKNLCIYGLGGIITPFIGIKLIDIVISIL